MVGRRLLPVVTDALARQAAVSLVGPRQVGKTTLAHEVAQARPSLYLDLESREDRDKLAEPALFLRNFESRLVILDEVHRVPELFQTLRGLIDEVPRHGRRTGRFLLLTLAGAEIDLVLELPGGTLWAIEIKRGLAPRPEKGFHFAREDLKPQRTFVVYSGTERYPISSSVEAIGIRELAAMLAAA